jgi:late competence protein required for DNA uptake (superfamily II DNA/RNA helicase)
VAGFWLPAMANFVAPSQIWRLPLTTLVERSKIWNLYDMIWYDEGSNQLVFIFFMEIYLINFTCFLHSISCLMNYKWNGVCYT